MDLLRSLGPDMANDVRLYDRIAKEYSLDHNDTTKMMEFGSIKFNPALSQLKLLYKSY